MSDAVIRTEDLSIDEITRENVRNRLILYDFQAACRLIGKIGCKILKRRILYDVILYWAEF